MDYRLFNPFQGEDRPGRAALPIKEGDTVVIPKGTEVRSTNPRRKLYTTGRALAVRVDHILSGRYLPVFEALMHHEEAFANQPDLLAKLRDWKATKAPEYYAVLVLIDPPAVRWAGSGGYWCEVPMPAVQRSS